MEQFETLLTLSVCKCGEAFIACPFQDKCPECEMKEMECKHEHIRKEEEWCDGHRIPESVFRFCEDCGKEV